MRKAKWWKIVSVFTESSKLQKMNVVILLVLAHLTTARAKCLERCHCSKYKTSCAYSRLDQLPQHLENLTEFLSIEEDNITQLTREMITDMRPYKLKTFKLEHTNTQRVQSGTFQDMKQLRILSLTYNEIDTIRTGTFEGLHGLLTLNLSRNMVQSFEPGSFHGLLALRTLDLSYNNITELRRDLFDGIGCSNNCDEICCHTSLYNKLDFSYNLIKEIEVGTFQNLCIFTQLNLRSNKLTKLQPKTFSGLSQLKHLNLGFNKISDIEKGAFDDLTNLNEIILIKNNIYSLQKGIFRGVPNLKNLILGFSGVNDIQQDVFRNLSQLTNLEISLNTFNILESCSFCGLSSLRTLELDESSIETLNPGTFKNLSSLTTLDLSWNEIEELSPGLFEGLVQLRTLELHGNSIHTLEPEAFHNLGLLQTLTLSDNSNNLKLSESVFQELVNLKYLYLSYSRIENVDPETFHGLHHLKYLDLSNNNIESICNGTFKNLTRLDYLDLTDNSMLEMEAGALEGLQVIKTLGLHLHIRQDAVTTPGAGTLLSVLMQDVLHVQQLKLTGLQRKLQSGEFASFHLLTLDLSRNSLSTLETDTFIGLSMLKKLLIFESEVHTIDVGAFQQLHDLTELSLEGNRLKSLKPGVFQGLKSLQKLYLSRNDIPALNEGVFGNISCTELVQGCLYVAASHDDNSTCQVSHTLTMLQLLDLSFNDISYIHPHTFVGMVHLETLDLKSNLVLSLELDSDFLYIPSLRVLEISFSEISNLSTDIFRCTPKVSKLDLSVNRLKFLDVDILRNFEKFEYLNIDYNELECDCKLQKTWEWLQNHHVAHNDLILCGKTRTTWHDALFTLQCNRSVFFSETDVVSDDLQFFKQYVEPSILCLVLVTGLLGNGFLLYIFARHKEMRTGPNACILNLTIGDFLSLIVNLPLSYWDILHVNWDLGLPVCQLFMGFKDLTVGITVFSVVALSTQRYSVTVHSFQQSRGRCYISERTKIVLFLLIVWGLAISFTLPAFLTASVDTRCLFSVSGEEYVRQAWTIQLFVYCIIPVLVIGFRYIKTAQYLKTSIQSMPGETRATTQAQGRSRVANMAIILTAVFCISYIPNFLLRVLFIWKIIMPESKFTFFISFLSFCLFFCNSCFNPIALFCMSTSFRTLFLKHIRCGRVASQHPTNRVNIPIADTRL